MVGERMMNLMKKIAVLLLSAVLVLSFFVPPVRAEEKDEGALEITAPSAVLLEQSSGKVLFEKNSHEVRPCASITKVMTLILTFEAIEVGNLSYDEMLTASAHAASMGGSDIWLKEGESMSVNDLIKATVIMSANDAAVVLAEAVAGSEEVFVSRMNEKAAALGMHDTVFKNCNGLDEEGHVTSAYDVALMSRELMNYPKIFEYTLTWIDYVRNGETQLVNTNKLIKSYKGITGLKTGTTSKAGSCVAATAERDGMSLIAVVLGADTSDHRFSDAAAVLNYGFANYTVLQPELPKIEDVPVKFGMDTTVKARIDGTPKILASLQEKGSLETQVKLQEEIEAPVKKGDVIGSVSFSMGGKTACELPVKADGDVERITFSSAFLKILEWYLS